jgi:hypothetical protein
MGTPICGKIKKTRWARYSKSKPSAGHSLEIKDTIKNHKLWMGGVA